MSAGTFSESWHRVSGAQLGLLPSVAVHKQRFRGADWFVLRDTYTERFFRLTPEAWGFVARLDPRRTVDEVWQEYVDLDPEYAPGQEDVMAVLAQLHHSNLLYYGNKPDSFAIFDRYREFRQRELRGRLLGFLYIRVPLWDPNDWLNRVRGLVHLATSRGVVIAWFIVVLIGAVLAFIDAPRLADQTQGLLAPGNLGLLYVGLAGMKVLHELGHAFVVKRFGGNVHVMGVMFLVFVPLPYVDATASWSFRTRRARMFVGAVGVLIELFLAAVGAVVWYFTGPGLLNALAFNVMLIGSISSLVFNGNPLLRFDAYYVFSDLVDIPNLYQRASQQWLYFADRYLLGTPHAESPARDRREWWWLTGYGASSFLYRLLVVLAILMFVTDEYFAIGMLFAFTTSVMLVFMPAAKWLAHLRSERVHRNRARAWVASALLLLVPFAALAWIPLPNSIKAPGIIEAIESASLSSSVAGRLVSLRVADGVRVEAGDVIAQLQNPALELDLAIVGEQIRETLLLRNLSLEGDQSELAPLRERLAYLEARKVELERRIGELDVRAVHGGWWVSPGLGQRVGTWIARGEPLGEIIEDRALRFSAVISQEEADRLFDGRIERGAIRLRGQADHTVETDSIVLLPYQRTDLPSSALGWLGGGEIAVSPNAEGGQQALESFYEVRALVPDAPEVVFVHRQTGWLRIPLAPASGLEQLVRSVRQVLQKRYQL